MNTIFCTLFDTNYLDKGMVLYKSMIEKIQSFKLYIFAFDDVSFEILKKENLKNVVVISLADFETEKLKEIKKKRTKTEYCWTCTPFTIKYVFEHFKEKICTYIDADMMFFSDPTSVFNELDMNNQSIIIVPHRYNSKKQEQKEGEKTGFYCVEFNTFKNDKNGNKALDWWASSCLKWCHYVVPDRNSWYGDQKYLNLFPLKFEGVCVCHNIGVGLGPWNDKKVHLYDDDSCSISKGKHKEKLVIYHYAGVRYITKNFIIVSSRIKDKKLHSFVFDDYIKKILIERQYFYQKYGFQIPKTKRTLTKNFLINFYQKYIMLFKNLFNFNNLYSEKKIVKSFKEHD